MGASTERAAGLLMLIARYPVSLKRSIFSATAFVIVMAGALSCFAKRPSIRFAVPFPRALPKKNAPRSPRSAICTPKLHRTWPFPPFPIRMTLSANRCRLRCFPAECRGRRYSHQAFER